MIQDGLIAFSNTFKTEKACAKYLAKMRWPDGVICPLCKHTKAYKYTTRSWYKCAKCRRQFNVKTGTIFALSQVPLTKWFLLIYLMTSGKKGITSIQTAKLLGVTQKTAWIMLTKIRYSLQYGDGFVLKGNVEIDETYYGKKSTSAMRFNDKSTVVALVERGGNVVAQTTRDNGRSTLYGLIQANVEIGSTVHTDEFKAYQGIDKFGYTHKTVNHSKGLYVSKDCHTNSVEGFWSHLKRGLKGTNHFVSKKHLNKYVKEYQFRYNTRNLSDIKRFEESFSYTCSRDASCDKILVDETNQKLQSFFSQENGF